MKRKPATSLCISTYNWPGALELCLESVLLQTHMPNEVIIGDDGSKEETRQTIERLKVKFNIPVVHIWQPDEGFKLATIRNRSFAAATGDYIIQVDGDVILNRFFVEDHLRFAKKKAFIAGSRSLLTKESSSQVFAAKAVKNIEQYELLRKHNTWRFFPAAYINYLVQQGIKEAGYVLGANMSFWKEDLFTVNGYNEDFQGWGKEDNDLAVRLCNAGVQLHFLKFAGVIYHLYHNEAIKDSLPANEEKLQRTKAEKQTFVANGLSKYLK